MHVTEDHGMSAQEAELQLERKNKDRKEKAIKDFLVNKLNIQSLKKWTRLEEGNDTYTYCTLDLCYAEEHKITHIHPEDEFSNIIAEQSRTDFP